MDIVDYINEVDRSNREQEAAYRVTLSKRGFRIPLCVLCSPPLLRRGLLHLYHITGDYNENIHFCELSQKQSVSYMQKAPARSETRVGALFC